MSTTIPSFEIAPLGDRLNMFENHEATDKRDKIYALLGLSSDNALTPDLRPDYTKSWSTLFKQVASHVLGSTAVISVVERKSQAVVSESGCALGIVAKCKGGSLTVSHQSSGALLVQVTSVRQNSSCHMNVDAAKKATYLYTCRTPAVRVLFDHVGITLTLV